MSSPTTLTHGWYIFPPAFLIHFSTGINKKIRIMNFMKVIRVNGLSYCAAISMMFVSLSLCCADSLGISKEIVLSRPGLSVAISRNHGTVTRISSLKPIPVDVLKETEDGLALVIKQLPDGKPAVFNIATEVIQNSDNGYEKVTATLVPSDTRMAKLARAHVEYRMYPDMFRALISVESLTDADGPFEISFGQLNPRTDYWTRESIPRLWGNRDVPATLPRDKVQQSGAPVSLEFWMQYNNHPDDVTTDHLRANVPLETIRLPFCIFESPDRFMLWGQMDVNGFVYVAPGHGGRNPCVFRMPRRLSKGERYSFELTYKFLTKSPELDYAEVYQWYGQNCYSTNRLTKGIVTIPKNLKPRTLIGEGNAAGQPSWPAGRDTAYNDFARKAKIGHIWDGWTEWDEVPTLQQSWISPDGKMRTEEEARNEVKTRHSLGYKCYSYRRQLFPAFAFRDDTPWKKDWMLYTRPGLVQIYPQGPSLLDNLPYTDPVSPGVQKHLGELGIAQPKPGFTSYIHVDMCDDECRNWYLKALEDWIDKYDCLDGFAFDMGWDLWTVPCIKHPEDGVHHGTAKFMSDMYRYLGKKHPDMRIVANMAQGEPPNLWAHAVIFEGAPYTTPEDIESIKIYRLTLLGYYYVYAHRLEFKEQYAQKLYYNMMSNLAQGLTIGFGDPLEFAKDPNLNGKLDLYSLSAKLTCVPLVIESGSFLVDGHSRREVYRSVFADSKSCYALIFNNTGSLQVIRARVRGKYLKRYGWNGNPIPTQITQFDADCEPKAISDFKVRRAGTDLLIEGTLQPNELLGLSSQQVLTDQK